MIGFGLFQNTSHHADALNPLPLRKRDRHATALPPATVEYNKKLINMSYELMGIRQVIERSMELEAIALSSASDSPEIEKFNSVREKNGLKAALEWNAARFAEEDAWFRGNKADDPKVR